MQVVYLVGSSSVYLTTASRFSLVFGRKLFTSSFANTRVPLDTSASGDDQAASAERARRARVGLRLMLADMPASQSLVRPAVGLVGPVVGSAPLLQRLGKLRGGAGVRRMYKCINDFAVAQRDRAPRDQKPRQAHGRT